jgi:hypothetical protein
MDREWQDFLIKGVNLGGAIPGSFPGQAAIDKAQYVRWLKQMADMNVNTLRVYSIHPPSFYQALFEYNMKAKNPIFLLHGIWTDDSYMDEYKDAYADVLFSDFQEEIRHTIDVVHGNAVIKNHRGHASGSYRFNVAPYVMGYLLVEEMEPDFVIGTNENNSHKEDFRGEFLYTKGASPYEIWLAEVADYTITYEQYKYGGPLKPMSWTNWPTTDPIEHLNEPNRIWEDVVSVDLEHIHATEKFTAGVFASYHIYPYFPDFMRLTPEYNSYIDSTGKQNPYEAYLIDLKRHHKMPIVVAEFGLPTSRGVARNNYTLGYNHGGHTEKEQGEAVADMFDSIIKTGYAGGIVFAWQDEWFKKTWNSEDMDVAENRPYWSNYMVPEQCYGLLSIDPGRKAPMSHVDGDISEWKGKKPLISSDGMELYVMNDEKYVYFLLKDSKRNVETQKYYIGADIVRGLGSDEWREEGIFFSRLTDIVIVIDGKKNTRVLVEGAQDTYNRKWSRSGGYFVEDIDGNKILIGNFFENDPRMMVKNSGIFNTWRLLLCRPLFLPQTKEHIPIDILYAGKLLHGNSNPESLEYNNLADFYISSQNEAIELRIPWMLLNAADPSTRMFYGDLYAEGINIDPEHFTTNPTETDGIYFELRRAGDIISAEPVFYTWFPWGDSPSYHERLKESYYMIQKKFAEY